MDSVRNFLSSLPATLWQIGKDIFTYFKPTSTAGVVRLIVLVVIVGGGVYYLVQQSAGADVAESQSQDRLVTLTTAAETGDASNITLLGTVEAINESALKTEAAGRITRVSVKLGDQVAAGTVVAELENGAQYAALLQAEGAYEAAQAAAAKSDVSVTSAETALRSAQNTAVSTYRSAYSTVNSIVVNDIDQVFRDPNSDRPSLLIDGANRTAYLNSTRVALGDELSAWQTMSTQLSTSDDLTGALNKAIADTTHTIELLDVIIARLDDDQQDYSNTQFANLLTVLTADRGVLTNTVTSLETQVTALQQAGDALVQAQLGGTQSDVSSANAQVKQALGALKAAQAAYAKTIVRSPIAGTVNVLSVKTGDFVGVQAPVAVIANNNALEITVFVGESDKARLSEGMEVQLKNNGTGVVTEIAPAINPETRKFEVTIQTESDTLVNGDTVEVIITDTASTPTDTSAPIRIPLTAVKFTATDGFIFTVEDNTAVAKPVTIGPVVGSLVTITGGLDRTTEFVKDARGLSDGESVITQ